LTFDATVAAANHKQRTFRGSGGFGRSGAAQGRLIAPVEGNFGIEVFHSQQCCAEFGCAEITAGIPIRLRAAAREQLEFAVHCCCSLEYPARDHNQSNPELYRTSTNKVYALVLAR
jgi:hypothetical protein